MGLEIVLLLLRLELGRHSKPASGSWWLVAHLADFGEVEFCKWAATWALQGVFNSVWRVRGVQLSFWLGPLSARRRR
jgi:hypothetical protein